MTSAVRKPDFLIIGAPRAGTSWVWSQLAGHPGTDLPTIKEPFFFGAAEIYRKGLDWYYELFRDKDPEKVTGEGSTSNFYDRVPFFYNKGNELVHDYSLPTIPQLICDELGDVKIVLCLRDPVERAISHFRMFQGQGAISPFASLRDVAERLPKLRLVEYGHYARYLELWRRYIPEERLFILVFEEDIRGQPETSMERLFSFLGLDPEAPLKDPTKPVNRSIGRARGAVRFYLGETFGRPAKMATLRWIFDRADAFSGWPAAVEPLDVEYLRARFLSDRQALEAMLGRELSTWDYGARTIWNTAGAEARS